MKIAVIGGGIFGMVTAIILSNKHKVTVFEKNSDIMLNASKCNHNRVHFGFHYPRSVETAKQSLEGYDSFYANFKNAIINNFPNYYLIENNSKITTDDYLKFCNNIGLKIIEEYPNLDINTTSIATSFLTNEPIFDFNLIKKIVIKKSNNINILLNTTIKSQIELNDYDVIINTSYSELNHIRNIFNIQNKKMKFQDVVIPIFETNLDKIGLTIMDGDFCSILPNGNKKNSFLLYHVNHSVLNENEGFSFLSNPTDIDFELNKIYLNSEKYFNFIKNCTRLDYYRTVRTIPINTDDGRLSVFDINIVNDKKVISVLSGKITTCWLIANKILEIL